MSIGSAKPPTLLSSFVSTFFKPVVTAQLDSFSAAFCPAVNTTYECANFTAQPVADVSTVEPSVHATLGGSFIAALSRSFSAAYVASQLSAFGGPEQPTQCVSQHPAHRSAV